MTNTINTAHSFQVFIVPNRAWVLGSGYEWQELSAELGDVSELEKMVQLWWFNPSDSKGRDNTCAHRGDGHEIISEYVPASWLADLKEGESKVLSFPKGDVAVTANQSDFRYRRFGNFEDVLALVLG